MLIEVVGKTLRGATDRVDIHAARSGTDDAAQATRPEFQVIVKRFDGSFLVVAHGLELGTQIGFGHVLEPTLEQFSFTRHGRSFRRMTLMTL